MLDYAITIPKLSIQTNKAFQLYLAIKRASEYYQGVEDQDMRQYIVQVDHKKFYIEEGMLVYKDEIGEGKMPVEQFFRNPRKLIK